MTRFRRIQLFLSATLIAALLPLTINISSAHAIPPEPPAPGMGWTAQPAGGYRSWFSVATSSDGSTIIAGTSDGSIQISHDSGLTWDAELARSFGGTFTSVTVGSDGMNMAATSFGTGSIWGSSNSGLDWQPVAYLGEGVFTLASSSDGSRLLAGSILGWLMESSDYGVHWWAIGGTGFGTWWDVAMSGDGVHLVVADNQGQRLLTSSDFGITWQVRLSGQAFTGVTSSSDGTHLAIASYGGYIYTSTDSGETWTERPSAGSRHWASLTSSSDGRIIVAGADISEGLFISSDFGQTWSQQTWLGEGPWLALASNNEGSKIIVGSFGGSYLSTYLRVPIPSTLRSLTPATISMDQNEITCSSGTLLYSSEGHGAEPAVLTSASFRLVSSTGVAATSSSMGTSAHFARSSLTSGERYTCQIVAIEKDAMATLSTEDLILKEKVLQTERADLAVVVSTYYQARAAALTAKNAAVAALMASGDHNNRNERLAQITQRWHLAINQALSNKEMATKAAHAKSAATLATAGVSVVN